MDLDKVFSELNESAEEIAGAGVDIAKQGLPTYKEMDDGKKLTPMQTEIVRNLIVDLPPNVSAQVKTLLGQAARWMTFEELLKTLVDMVKAGGTKTITADSVPTLNKSQTIKARKVE